MYYIVEKIKLNIYLKVALWIFILKLLKHYCLFISSRSLSLCKTMMGTTNIRFTQIIILSLVYKVMLCFRHIQILSKIILFALKIPYTIWPTNNVMFGSTPVPFFLTWLAEDDGDISLRNTSDLHHFSIPA